MTRGEAHIFGGIDRIWQVDTNVVDILIDKIYDEFEQRTCRNCTYSRPVEGYPTIECLALSVKYLHTMTDFSCSKWEKS